MAKQACPRSSTRQRFLAAYRSMLNEGDNDLTSYAVNDIVALAAAQLKGKPGGARRPRQLWQPDAEARQAFRMIGCTGRVSLQALRALPAYRRAKQR